MPPPTKKRYSLSLRMQTALAILLFIYIHCITGKF